MVETVQISKVLCNAPSDLLVDSGPVPLDQFLGIFDVLSNWFLRENVLSGKESLANVRGLIHDWETDNDGLYV